MTRFWLRSVALFLSVTCSLAISPAFADHGGHGGGRSFGSASRFGGGNAATRVQHSPFKGNVGGNLSPARVTNGNTGPFRPATPKFPTGPLNPTKHPTGPFKPPVVINPTKPTLPIGPIGPIKPPKGPIVGPIKPPHGPIGPIGPIKPPKGPIVGPILPPIGPVGPIGPIKPPGGGSGGGSGGGTGGGNGHHHHRPHWPAIVLGCLPCTGTIVGGTYCPPVYSQPVVVPVTTPVVVSSAAPIASAPLTTDVATASAEAAVEPATTADPAITDPAASAEKLPQVPVGSTLALQAKDLGEKTGQVLLVIDKLTLGVQIDEWAAEHTIATIPQIGITQPTKAELVVVRADGQPASSVKVELVAAKTDTSTDPAKLADTRN